MTAPAIWPPIAGTYAITLVRNGPLVPVRLWFGVPIIDGEEQDRSPRWCAEIDGKTDTVVKDPDTGARCTVPIDIDRAWPYCAKRPVSDADYRFYLARGEWAREHSPDHFAAKPRERMDLGSLPGIF